MKKIFHTFSDRLFIIQMAQNMQNTQQPQPTINGSIATPPHYQHWPQGWAPYQQYAYAQPHQMQSPVMRPVPQTVHKDVDGSFSRVEQLPDVTSVKHRPARTDQDYDQGEVVEEPLDETKLTRLRQTIREYLREETETLEVEGFIEDTTLRAYQNREDQLTTLQNQINDHKTHINSAINKFLKDIAAECQQTQNQLYTTLDNFYEQYAADYEQFIKDVSFFGEKAIGMVKEEKKGLTTTETQHLHHPYTHQYVKSETVTTPRQANNVDVERATRLCHGMRENSKVEQNGAILQEQFDRSHQLFDKDALQEIIDAQFLLVRNGLRTEGKQQSSINVPNGEEFKRAEKTDLPTVARVIRPPAEEEHRIDETGSLLTSPPHNVHQVASPVQMPVQQMSPVHQPQQFHYQPQQYQQPVVVSPTQNRGYQHQYQHQHLMQSPQNQAHPLPYQTIQPPAYNYVPPHQLDSHIGGHRLVTRSDGRSYNNQTQGETITTPDKSQRKLFQD